MLTAAFVILSSAFAPQPLLRTPLPCAARTPPPPISLVPLAPVALAAGVAAFAVQYRRSQGEADALAKVEWYDTSDGDSEDGCLLIGEESGEGGKAWFVCQEPSSDPQIECSPVEKFGNMRVSGANDDEYLCKAPKPA